MLAFKDLSQEEKEKIIKELRLDNQEYILTMVLNGDYCVRCLRIYYNCLCSHEDL